MGGFSRRRSKLINSCEYSESELWTPMAVQPNTGEGHTAASGGLGIPREDHQDPGDPGRPAASCCVCARLPTCLTLPPLHLSTPVAQLLYQEYSDVALNKEIQSQQRLDSLAEAPGPASPRQPRRTLVSSESYLQRLSMASSSSLWQEIPVVRNSTVLLSMTHEDQKLQEVPRGARRGGAGRGAGGEAKAHSLEPWSPAHRLHHQEQAVPTTHHTLAHATTAGKLRPECHHCPHLCTTSRHGTHRCCWVTHTEWPCLCVCWEECRTDPITAAAVGPKFPSPAGVSGYVVFLCSQGTHRGFLLRLLKSALCRPLVS